MSNIRQWCDVRWIFWMKAPVTSGVVATGWRRLAVDTEPRLGRMWHGRRVYRLGVDPLPTAACRRVAESVIIGDLLIEARRQGRDVGDYYDVGKYHFTWADEARTSAVDGLADLGPCSRCGWPVTGDSSWPVHLHPTGRPGSRHCNAATRQWVVAALLPQAADTWAASPSDDVASPRASPTSAD